MVIFGRPGSGKSSLAERLSDDYGYSLVRTGELLRAAIRKQDFLGKRVQEHLNRGDLVPDLLIFELLEKTLTNPGVKRLLFDGFPRTIGQVPLLEAFEKKLDFRIGAYLDIAVSRIEAVRRMTGRRVCPKCGATYHLINRPPLKAETCNHDGTHLERRKDDAHDVVEFRQKTFDVHAKPILDHYRATAPERFFHINGEQSFDAVYAETVRALHLEAKDHSARDA